MEQGRTIEELEENLTFTQQDATVEAENRVTTYNANYRAKELDVLLQELNETEERVDEEIKSGDSIEYNNAIFDRLYLYKRGEIP